MRYNIYNFAKGDQKMEEFVSKLTPSDYIQICGIMTALIASFVSIIISIISLRQNSKIIKESNMAQIVIFPFNFSGDMFDRIVIKNFGNTTGLILDIAVKPSDVLDEMIINPFIYYKNMSLAPNQSFTTILQNKKINADNKIEPFDVTIKYKTLNKIKTETFHIDYNFTNALLTSGCSSKDPLEKSLDKITQSIQALQQR